MELENGHVKVDEFQNTTASGIYALGDVAGKALLTPGAALCVTYLITVIAEDIYWQKEYSKILANSGYQCHSFSPTCNFYLMAFPDLKCSKDTGKW